MDVSSTNEAECSRKVASGRGVAGAIRSLVNARCARVLYESSLMPVLTYGSETMIWREKERSRLRAVQMDNIRGLLDIRRMDKVAKVRIRKFWVVTKGVDEKIDEGVFRSAIWKQWRTTELLRGYMFESVLVVDQWVDHGRGGFIP